MQVHEIMNNEFQSISQQAAIRDVAQRMRDLDVGMLPVEANGEIVGTITDRDITVRAVAEDVDPQKTPIGAIMSHDVLACVENDELQQAARIMEEHQVRRLMVQNVDGAYVGMLSLADLALHDGTEGVEGEILEAVPQPNAGRPL